MSLNKISTALGDKAYHGKMYSETETIELDLIQSFPVGVKETIKQRRSNEIGNIKIEDDSKPIATKTGATSSILRRNIVKIETNSRKISSDGPETPSTGAVGRYWKWSESDITPKSSNNSLSGNHLKQDELNIKDRARNISITSTTSKDSASSNLTDINPYISLIHSDSLRRHTRGTIQNKAEKSLDHESRLIGFLEFYIYLVLILSFRSPKEILF